MTAKTDLTAARVSRRTYLKTSAGAALVAGTAGSLALPQRAKAATGLVALVHTQAAGDNGPIDSMIAALKKLSDEQGFPIRTIYAQDSATFPTIFETLADAGAEVIVGTFNEVAEPIKELAPKFPDTKFIQIFGDAFEPVMPNVVTVSYDYYLGCYLSGLFAAKVSKPGKIGYIGGVSLPPLNADLN
ncbi:MAG: BMP family ABC transporter substrate-binding protein, partial [Bauldia litoralis]